MELHDPPAMSREATSAQTLRASAARPSGSAWAWLPLGLLLGFKLSVKADLLPLPLLDDDWHWLNVEWFLPILAGWLGSRFGSRGLRPMLVLGVLSLISVEHQWTDQWALSWRLTVDSYLVALPTFLAFALHRERHPSSLIPVQSKWALVPWFALCAFPLVPLDSVTVHSEETSSVLFDLTWQPYVVAVVALLLLATGSLWRRLFPAERKVRRAVLMTGASIVLLWMQMYWSLGIYLPDMSSPSREFEVHFGLRYVNEWWSVGIPWLPSAFFAATAFGRLDWRVLAGGATAMLLASMGLEGPSALLTAFSSPDLAENRHTIGVFEMYLGQALRLCSASLLGAAIQPFWLRGETDLLRTRRTSLFLAAAFVLELLAQHHGGTAGPYILCGIAFIAASAWRVEGVFLALFIAQLSTASAMVGAILFPFAFVGLLSSRLGDDIEPVYTERTPSAPLAGPVAS